MKAISTTYYGPGNVRGSRILARDEDNNRVTLSYNDELSSTENHDAAAVALCAKMGWVGHDLVRGATKAGHVYVFDAPWERLKLPDTAVSAARKAQGARAAKQLFSEVR